MDLRAGGVRTCFTERKKYIDLEILLMMVSIWNLKFNRGSINIPRNLIAGTTELEVTRVRELDRWAVCTSLSLLKFNNISTFLARILLQFVNRIHFFFRMKCQLVRSKKIYHILNSTFTLAIRLSIFGSESSNVVSSANRRAKSSEQRGRSLI